jgi:hypothetical protein
MGTRLQGTRNLVPRGPYGVFGWIPRRLGRDGFRRLKPGLHTLRMVSASGCPADGIPIGATGSSDWGQRARSHWGHVPPSTTQEGVRETPDVVSYLCAG